MVYTGPQPNFLTKTRSVFVHAGDVPGYYVNTSFYLRLYGAGLKAAHTVPTEKCLN